MVCLKPKEDVASPHAGISCHQAALEHRGRLRVFHESFPMYVVRVRDLIEFTVLRPHQELLAAGLLHEWHENMTVLFVSHQWRGRDHPDADMEQFKNLQEALRNRMNGNVTIGICPAVTLALGRLGPISPLPCEGILDAYVWYDYFAVPQPGVAGAGPEVVANMLSAIDSIPAYVEKCDYFFVLAPAVRHRDSGEYLNIMTWLERGWCLLEQAAWALTGSRTDGLLGRPVTVVFGPTTLIEAALFYWCVLAPGRGHFTSEDDRPKVDGLVQRMLDARVCEHERNGTLFGANFTRALGFTYARHVSALVVDGKEWLRTYGVEKTSMVGCGWSPLHFAALEGNLEMIRFLVHSGVPVDIRTSGKNPDISASEGLTPAAIAAFYLPEEHAIATVLELCNLGADIFKVDAKGFSLLHLAAWGVDRPSLCRFLLDRGLKVDARTFEGSTALNVACESRCNAYRTAELLIQSGADVNASDNLGRFPLFLASMFGCRITELLLKAGADPNKAIVPYTKQRIIRFASAAALHVKPELTMAKLLSNFPGMTALHAACFLGNAAAVEKLLASGADPEQKNRRMHSGRSLDAFGFATFMGFSHVLKLMRDESHCTPDGDASGGSIENLPQMGGDDESHCTLGGDASGGSIENLPLETVRELL